MNTEPNSFSAENLRLKRVNALANKLCEVFTTEITDGAIRFFELYPERLKQMATILTQVELLGKLRSIQRIQAHINAYYTDPLTLTQAAKIAGMNRFYFSKEFKRQTGVTFTRFVNEVRVRHVKVLLCNPEMRVGEAAWSAGFKALTSFNRTFRRIVGKSPKKYRKSLEAECRT